jgi:hypothetical protein
MHGQKKRRKRTIAGQMKFDDFDLEWELISEPQWSNSGDGYKGLCISVWRTGTPSRELILEYPYPTDREGRPLPVPQRPPVSAKLVEQDVRRAIEAGWDPEARGKPMVFRAPSERERKAQQLGTV